MADNMTSVLGGMPPTLKAATVGSGLGAGLALATTGTEGLLGNAIYYGAVSGAAAYIAPMLTDDPMFQLAGSAATGVGARALLAGTTEGMMSGLLIDGGVPAASLYLSRNL